MKTLYKLDGTIATNDLLQLNDLVSNSNHIKFPDGTLMQWGNITKVINYNYPFNGKYYGAEIIMFPIAFTNSNKSCFADGKIFEDNGSFNVPVIYSDSFVLNVGGRVSGNLSTECHWFAIGRWK